MNPVAIVLWISCGLFPSGYDCSEPTIVKAVCEEQVKYAREASPRAQVSDCVPVTLPPSKEKA